MSDPWEFCTESGTGPFNGVIKDKDTEHILIELDCPIHYQGMKFKIAVSRPRHNQTQNEDILKGEPLPSNILLMTSNEMTLTEANKDKSAKYTSVIGDIQCA